MKGERPKDPDLELWAAITRGDQSAFDTLYRKHVQLLYRYGLNLGVGSEKVKDAIQDLFSDLWRKRQQLQIDKSFKNYLLRSLRRLLFRKVKQGQTLDLNEENEPFFSPQELLDTSADILEKRQLLKQALQQLPKRQREAIHLRYYENMDYEAIGETMSIQVGAVYKLVSTGIKRLREM